MGRIIIPLVVIAVVILIVVLRRKQTPRQSQVLQAFEQFRVAQGAQRCVLAVELFKLAAATGLSATVAKCWQNSEGLLLEALADCPPDLKPALAAALEDCHSVCRDRFVQRALMSTRNSLEP